MPEGIVTCADLQRGIAYAISKLSMANVFIYLDAAHGGWLGWPRNLPKSVALYKEVLAMAGGPDRIRGRASFRFQGDDDAHQRERRGSL